MRSEEVELRAEETQDSKLVQLIAATAQQSKYDSTSIEFATEIADAIKDAGFDVTGPLES